MVLVFVWCVVKGRLGDLGNAVFNDLDGVWILEKHGFNYVFGFFLFCCFVVAMWLDL